LIELIDDLSGCIFGRGELLLPAELQAIHRCVVETPVLETVTDEIRAVVEIIWPSPPAGSMEPRARRWKTADAGLGRGRRQVVFERAPFHMSGHVPSLLRDFDQLLLDKWIAGLFGPLFALKGLGAVLLWLACPHATPPCVR
jgi:hypothetical protein